MNEQQLADELSKVLDGRHEGQMNHLPIEDTQFAAQMLALRDQTRPDTTFAAALEAKLKAAPNSSFAHPNEPMNRGVIVSTYRQTHSLRNLAAVAAVLALVVVATLTVPPLRTLAQDVFNLLFQQTATDTVSFETPIVHDIRPTPIAPLPEVVPSEQQLEQAIAQAGFPVLLPAFVPEGYVLADASYDSVASQVSLFYTRNGIGLVLVQTPVEFAQPLDVGATAAIVPVSVGRSNGQYVEGGWKVNPEISGDTMTVTEQIWDAELPFQQLRWQNGEMVYWMMSVVGQHSDLSLQTWTQIAESLR